MVRRIARTVTAVTASSMLVILVWLSTSLGGPVAREAATIRETAPRQEEPSRAVPNGRIDERTGILRSRFGESFTPRPGSAESMAEEYLRSAASMLGMSADLADLEHVQTRAGLGTRHVQYRQTYRGIPVFGADVVVSIHDARGTVVAVTSEYKPGVELPSVAPLVSATDAALRASEELIPGAPPVDPFRSELLVHSRESTHRLAYRIVLLLSEPAGDWEVFVDATSGEVFSVRDLRCYADGSGLVFHPDPITTAEVPYGTDGYVDSDDADSPELSAARVQLPLPGITLAGGFYQLSGPYVTIQDYPAIPPDEDGIPYGDSLAAYQQTDPNGFNYTRSEKGFEAVMVYAHMTGLQNWIQALGFVNVNNDQDFVDPHGENGADNSFYSSATDGFAFGEGGVDDAEDAGVIVHEYGHAIHHNQVPGWGQFHEGQSMGEGFGDYLAGSYVEALGTYQSNWVFKWDGPFYSGMPGGRRLDSDKMYPDDLEHQKHADGEIWSACLWQVRGALGRPAADAIVIQSHFYLTPGATFRDGALAIIQADRDVNGGANGAAIEAIFNARGILRIQPFPVFAGPGNQWTPAVTYDRTPGYRFPGWGYKLLTLWDTPSPGPSAARRVNPSGGVDLPVTMFPGLSAVDAACAPLQAFPNGIEPSYLVVGVSPAGGGNIEGRLVANDSAATVTPIPPIAATPISEGDPAVGAIGATYCVAYVITPPGSPGTVGVVMLDDTGMATASITLPGPNNKILPAVCGGVNPVTLAEEYLVAWMEQPDPDFGEFNIRAQRVSAAGALVGGVLPIAEASPMDVFQYTPSVAFDGTNYLVVWTRNSGVEMTWQVHGRFVSSVTGGMTPGFLIEGTIPTGSFPDVAFAGREFLVVWYTNPEISALQDVMGKRLGPGPAPLFSDPVAIPIGVTPNRERRPVVTQVGGDNNGTRGQGFFVAWDQRPPVVDSYDIWGAFVPETTIPEPPPVPIDLGVTVAGPPDTTAAPGDTLMLQFTVTNTGDLRDGYILTAAPLDDPWLTVVLDPAIVLDPDEVELALVSVIVPMSRAAGDSNRILLTATSKIDPSVTDGAVAVIHLEGGATGIAGLDGPSVFGLDPNVPNPFRSTTEMRFSLPSATEARLDVFSVSGRRVRNLASGPHAAGRYRVVWDGLDERGRQVASGVYFYELRTSDRRLVRRMILTR